MANEHTLLLETELPSSMTCADGTGIEKGTLLKLTDPNTASASTGHVDEIAGVAAGEKIASDGITAVAVYKGGEFKATASGSISIGDDLVTSGGGAPNVLESAGTGDTKIVGESMEAVTTGQTFRYRLNPRRGNAA